MTIDTAYFALPANYSAKHIHLSKFLNGSGLASGAIVSLRYESTVAYLATRTL